MNRTLDAEASKAAPVVVLTRRALIGCGLAALGIGALSGWLIAAGQVAVQTGALTGVQAYAALLSAIFGILVAGFAALGAFGGYVLGVALAPTSRPGVAACVGGGAVVALGALLAVGTGATLGWRPVALETVALGLYVFAVAAGGYVWAARDRPVSRR
ncbi:MAG: hypothetical protein WBL06_13140 [Pseudolysinimonas sp.]|uniref:hypothetical protein n=1 Tax=Pseudolysinimonas sp. TaxID=2680009 RepID=UPI003C76748B